MSQALPSERPLVKPSTPRPDPPPKVGLAKLDFVMIVTFLGLTFLLGVFPLKDTDFWWHLKAGDMIRQTGEIPRVDTFTYGAEGRPWIDLHWGFQVAVSWLYGQGGVVALNLAKCAITCLAVFLLITARKRDWPVWLMLLVWLPALLVLSGRMYIRPETISLLYLSMVLAILFRWNRQPWLAFALPVVQVFWVNTQGLFILEPIMIVFALVDEVVRPGSFSTERRRWWKLILGACSLSALACLCNPYGLAGAFYPIQLQETMRNPIFKETILELKPMTTFIEEVGLDNLQLKIHLATFLLGALSFVLPVLWKAWVGLTDLTRKPSEFPELAADLPKGKRKRETSKARKKGKNDPAEGLDKWSHFFFRALLFSFFSGLSLLATRNSHQFAAVVGTVTAWNFGEWFGLIRARRLRADPTATRVRLWPRLMTFGTIVLVILAVGSGRYYVWSGEGRTIGLGEEPLWFPKAAVKFAGEPGMPDKLVAFHNGHASLYEYDYAPAKKVYTDARLEVMGPEIYTAYVNLSRKLSEKTGNWAEELDKMGRPAVLVDNLQIGSSAISATLLNSRHWRCVYYDALAAVFVHESLAKIVADHTVDFTARHYQREAHLATADPAALATMARSLRLLGTDCHLRGDSSRSLGLYLLGLDYARREREVDPSAIDGWKNAGLIEMLRDILNSEEPIPRFRLPFDPVFDLSLARGTYLLGKALEIDPDEGIVQYYLANSYEMRGMGEAALPVWEKYAYQPNKNLTMQSQKARAASQVALLRAKLGLRPKITWDNRAELEPLVARLLNEGRASTAADLMESAFRPEARPWDWADRLAVLRLHHGEPARARSAWLAASTDVPSATRMARVAVTYLVEGDFVNARKSFKEAIAADPRSFEAHYGLAALEQDAGFADEALAEARQAEKLAPNEISRNASRTIATSAEPYARKPETKP
jgi:tetratricopeptide (TPR) repeat protein